VSGGGTNTVSQTTVPDWLKPYLTSNLEKGQMLQMEGGPQMEQQVAPLNDMQNAGLAQLQSAAGAPNANSAANAQLQNVESGAYLNPSTNPYLQSTFNTAAQGVQNSLDSQFGAAGRNILASAPVQSDEMNNLANQIYGGAYQSGMQNMMQGAALAPSVAQGQYMPGQEMLQAGAGLQGQAQNVLNAKSNEYNYAQALPYNTASWYSSLLGQNASPFMGSSQTSSPVTNPWMTGIGGAASGAAAGAALGTETGMWGGPIGAGVGAVAGGLLGAFG
jgi:hypothetical protein